MADNNCSWRTGNLNFGPPHPSNDRLIFQRVTTAKEGRIVDWRSGGAKTNHLAYPGEQFSHATATDPLRYTSCRFPISSIFLSSPSEVTTRSELLRSREQVSALV